MMEKLCTEIEKLCTEKVRIHSKSLELAIAKKLSCLNAGVFHLNFNPYIGIRFLILIQSDLNCPTQKIRYKFLISCLNFDIIQFVRSKVGFTLNFCQCCLECTENKDSAVAKLSIGRQTFSIATLSSSNSYITVIRVHTCKRHIAICILKLFHTINRQV